MKNFSNLDKWMRGLRREYHFGRLARSDLHPNPFVQFGQWFEEALKKSPCPNVMTLATASRKGRVAARTMLLKGFDENGFVFYTNFKSPKACDFHENPCAALVFYWPEIERQVRIEGKIRKVSDEESEDYFHSRPWEAQVGAWVSDAQSRPIKSRGDLEKRFQFFKKTFENCPVPLPPYWGGYRLAPAQIEFWQGREHRLNDRLRYRKKKKGGWIIERLQP